VILRSRKSPPPVLFATATQQALLLRMHREGTALIPAPMRITRLERAGLAVRWVGADPTDGRRRRHCCALDPRHPAFASLSAVLAELSGDSPARADLPTNLPPHKLRVVSALGHQDGYSFRIVLQVVAGGKPLTTATLWRRLPDVPNQLFHPHLKRLIRDDVLREKPKGTVSLAPSVPPALLGSSSGRPPRTPRKNRALGIARRWKDCDPSAGSAQDGAPRIFGADARLRHLMTLAKYGAMGTDELRRVAGIWVRREGSRFAPFGRGGVVRVWKTAEGPAIGLDPDYPLAGPMRDLLLALERVYPVPEFRREWEAPEPERRRWIGDRHALFGNVAQTTILTSIGVHGWTFEVLCMEMIAQNRVVVHKVVRRLEDEGILQGDRSRGSGFNVRVLTIANAFPAKAELEALLRAYVEAWPATVVAVRRGFERIAEQRPRGKAHLVRRGLWPY
jgi:hypothetical protein